MIFFNWFLVAGDEKVQDHGSPFTLNSIFHSLHYRAYNKLSALPFNNYFKHHTNYTFFLIYIPTVYIVLLSGRGSFMLYRLIVTVIVDPGGNHFHNILFHAMLDKAGSRNFQMGGGGGIRCKNIWWKFFEDRFGSLQYEMK